MDRATAAAEAVEQLYAHLAQALREQRSHSLDAPVTVAEIYQELVPYRTVRSEVGFAMNADYEHALLRLLAGENGRVRLEPSSARDVIRRELSGPNPNVGIYREYAGCDVFVTVEPPRPAALSTFALIDVDEEPEAEAEGGPETGVEADEAPAAAAPAAEVPQPRADAAQAPSPQSTGTAACAYCDSRLPTHRAVRFCPFCGSDQTTRPCGACGEPLEPGWLFCVACGADRGAA